MSNPLTRRAALTAAAAFVAAPAVARELSTTVQRNTASFVPLRWDDHFETLAVATVVADTRSKALHWWNADATDYRVYPTSVPMSEELTRRGYTEVVRKKLAPSWTPTANMRERNPDLPITVEGGVPENPLGTHAMYLSWPAYLIHGTHDTRKIGRASSSGCIGLYNRQIAELYDLCPVGTQVRLI